MRGTLTTDQIENLLHQQYIGRLGCHADDLTYVVPISYAYDGVYLYGHSYAGMKIDMMQKNPNVCLQVDNIDSMFNWKSAIVWGLFEILTTPEAQQHVSKVMLNNRPAFLPAADAGQEVIAFRILIQKKTGCFNYTEPQTEVYI